MTHPNESNDMVLFPIAEAHLNRLRKARHGVVDPVYMKRTQAHFDTLESLINWGLDEITAHSLVREIQLGTIPHVQYDPS